ncbi:TPA: hypothetical protein HA246_03510 [Candidatus Woesearchaeota archaeon]|nr:hypothetical protein [Candidatus Woesearchaeota archaeon]
MANFLERHRIGYKIVRESLKILLITSIINTMGGASIEAIQERLFALLPFLILLTPLNDFVGNLGTILASKFTTYLYLGKITDQHWYHNPSMRELMLKLMIIAIFCGLYLSIGAFVIAAIKGFEHGLLFSIFFLLRLVMGTLFTALLLLLILIFVTATFGWYVYKKNQDPDNFLVPLTTSIADIGTMVLFAATIHFLF